MEGSGVALGKAKQKSHKRVKDSQLWGSRWQDRGPRPLEALQSDGMGPATPHLGLFSAQDANARERGWWAKLGHRPSLSLVRGWGSGKGVFKFLKKTQAVGIQKQPGVQGKTMVPSSKEEDAKHTLPTVATRVEK